MNLGVWEFLLLVGAIGFYGFLLWLAWTLVMSVRGIHRELALLRKDLRSGSVGRPDGQ